MSKLFRKLLRKLFFPRNPSANKASTLPDEMAGKLRRWLLCAVQVVIAASTCELKKVATSPFSLRARTGGSLSELNARAIIGNCAYLCSTRCLAGRAAGVLPACQSACLSGCRVRKAQLSVFFCRVEEKESQAAFGCRAKTIRGAESFSFSQEIHHKYQIRNSLRESLPSVGALPRALAHS